MAVSRGQHEQALRHQTPACPRRGGTPAAWGARRGRRRLPFAKDQPHCSAYVFTATAFLRSNITAAWADEFRIDAVTRARQQAEQGCMTKVRARIRCARTVAMRRTQGQPDLSFSASLSGCAPGVLGGDAASMSVMPPRLLGVLLKLTTLTQVVDNSVSNDESSRDQLARRCPDVLARLLSTSRCTKTHSGEHLIGDSLGWAGMVGSMANRADPCAVPSIVRTISSTDG